MSTMSHSHGDGHHHHHGPGADHDHTHEPYDGPGSFLARELPIVSRRQWTERAFTIGIGG